MRNRNDKRIVSNDYTGLRKRERERERERETDRDRERDRQTDRQTERDGGREKGVERRVCVRERENTCKINIIRETQI